LQGPESPQLTGLAPLLDERCRVLVLGSFPGKASLEAQAYYGHSQNNFWRLLMDILPVPAGLAVTSSYQERSKWLLGQGVGLWDVYAACERKGSLDADIRHAQLNDLDSLKQRCPQLQAIGHNGGESYKHRRRAEALCLPVYKLPSTSPANAAMPYVRKLEQWRAMFALQGLCAWP
jgi:hypoxanthine-DNA glycosylase